MSRIRIRIRIRISCLTMSASKLVIKEDNKILFSLYLGIGFCYNKLVLMTERGIT